MSEHRHYRFTCILGLAALLSASLTGVRAQVTSATLTGTVRDSSGAVVPGARVRITNVATNLTKETASNPTGDYTLLSLVPGAYRLEVDAAGFKRAVLPGIVLQVAQEGRVDLQLEVGAVGESITVTSSVPLMETESPVIGGVINESRILWLPLNGRNFMELTTLTAGINSGNASSAKQGALNKGFGPSAAGMPTTENNYQLDGTDNREHFFNSYNLAPSVDAVREFKIQIGQYSAEFGAGGGAVINVVTKSGGNEFHGDVWEFVRNNVFDARNFFLPASQKIAPLRRNQFGVAAGGPVVRNRLFFFGNAEYTISRTGVLKSVNVPTDAQRGGDLSAFTTRLVDPKTRQPFPGNQIPASRIDPISARFVKLYPQPNTFAGPLNYKLNQASRDDLDSYLGRVDYNISSRQSLFGRYGLQRVDRFNPGNFATIGGNQQPQTYHGLGVGLTSTFRPTLLNEFRFAWSRAVNDTKGQSAGKPIAADLGIPFAFRDYRAGAPEGIGIARSTIAGISETVPYYLTDRMLQWYDGVTWVRGAHTLKTGADLRFTHTFTNAGYRNNGLYTFTGQFTGDGFADMLLGIPGTMFLQLKPNDPTSLRRYLMGFYVADEWKVRSNLVLDFGLRYELNSVPRADDGATPIFDGSMGGGIGGLMFPSQNTAAIPWFEQFRPDLPVGRLDRETLFSPDRNNFAPRFGFAWRPLGDNRFVVRGGYGWFYSSAQWNNVVQNAGGGPPANVAPLYVSDATTPTLTYMGPVGVPLTDALRTAPIGLITPVEDGIHDAYNQQWSLSIGHEFARNWMLEAQYLGSKSTRVENLYDRNATLPGPGAVQTRVRWNKWGRVVGWGSDAGASYHALLTTIEKRLSYGLMFRTNYTFGKALTKNGGRSRQGNLSAVQNPFNLRLENSRSTDDINHRFVTSFSYELPFGAGKPVGGRLPGWASKLVGGWTIAGITTVESGFPLNPTIGIANCNSSAFNLCRPDLLGDPLLPGNGVDSPRFARSAFDWPNNTARHPAQAPRFGTAGVNILPGNGLIEADLSLLKNISLGERFRFEFHFDSFNAPNHTNFGDPTASPESPLFGGVFSTRTLPRVNQFGLKLYW